MEAKTDILNAVTNIISNTHLNVTLDGWQAVVMVTVLCVSGLTAYDMKIKESKPKEIEMAA